MVSAFSTSQIRNVPAAAPRAVSGAQAARVGAGRGGAGRGGAGRGARRHKTPSRARCRPCPRCCWRNSTRKRCSHAPAAPRPVTLRARRREAGVEHGTVVKWACAAARDPAGSVKTRTSRPALLAHQTAIHRAELRRRSSAGWAVVEGARLRAAGCLRGGCQDERNPEQMVGMLCERARQRETPIRCWEHFARGRGGDLETGWLAEEQSGLAGHRDQVAEGPGEGRRVQERKRHPRGLVVRDVAVRSREVGSRTLFNPTQRTSLPAWALFDRGPRSPRYKNSSFVSTTGRLTRPSLRGHGLARLVASAGGPFLSSGLLWFAFLARRFRHRDEPMSHMVEQPGHRIFLLSAESTRSGPGRAHHPREQLCLAANVQVPVLLGAEDLVRDA